MSPSTLRFRLSQAGGNHTDACLTMIAQSDLEPDGLVFACDRGGSYLCIAHKCTPPICWDLQILHKAKKNEPARWGDLLMESSSTARIVRAIDAIAGSGAGAAARAVIQCWEEEKQECA